MTSSSKASFSKKSLPRLFSRNESGFRNTQTRKQTYKYVGVCLARRLQYMCVLVCLRTRQNTNVYSRTIAAPATTITYEPSHKTNTYVYTYIHVGINSCLCICNYLQTHEPRWMFECICVRACVCVYVSMYLCMYTDIYMCVCVCVFMYVYPYIYIYIYVYISIYTYIYIYIHGHAQV